MTMTGSQSAAMVSRWCSISSTLMPSARSAAQMLADLARQGGVHAGHRLVQQQQRGFGHQRAADLQQLLLPAGQVRGAVRAARGSGSGAAAMLLRRSRNAASRRRAAAVRSSAGQTRSPGWRGAIQHQVVQHGEARESRARSGTLRTRPAPVTRSARQPVMIWPVEADAAGIRRHQAGDAVEQRGLAGAVRTDQAGDAPGLHAQIDPAQRVHAVIAARQAASISSNAMSVRHLALRRRRKECDRPGA